MIKFLYFVFVVGIGYRGIDVEFVKGEASRKFYLDTLVSDLGIVESLSGCTIYSRHVYRTYDIFAASVVDVDFSG